MRARGMDPSNNRVPLTVRLQGYLVHPFQLGQEALCAHDPLRRDCMCGHSRSVIICETYMAQHAQGVSADGMRWQLQVLQYSTLHQGAGAQAALRRAMGRVPYTSRKLVSLSRRS